MTPFTPALEPRSGPFTVLCGPRAPYRVDGSDRPRGVPGPAAGRAQRRVTSSVGTCPPVAAGPQLLVPLSRTAPRVLHVTTSLTMGGAEMMLYKLITATHGGQLVHGVVSLTEGGEVRAMLEEQGIAAASLGMRRGVPDPRAVLRLRHIIDRERPDVVQSWMYHANLLAGLAAAGVAPVVWGIHHSDVRPGTIRHLTHWTRVACARLAKRLPVQIVCGGESVLRAHAALGYSADRMTVIPIGFDLQQLRPDPVLRRRVRIDLDLPEDAPVVGLLARFHPDKDHATFLRAAGRVAKVRPDVFFLLTGRGVTAENRTLQRMVSEQGLGDRAKLLGVVPDVGHVLASLDVLALSSRTEAFPTVLGEAMAVGVPCAATDCGDARAIVGPTGRIVPTGDPEALGGALLELLDLTPAGRAALGCAAREWVRQRYDLPEIARQYVAVYERARIHGRSGRPADGAEVHGR